MSPKHALTLIYILLAVFVFVLGFTLGNRTQPTTSLPILLPNPTPQITPYPWSQTAECQRLYAFPDWQTSICLPYLNLVDNQTSSQSATYSFRTPDYAGQSSSGPDISQLSTQTGYMLNLTITPRSRFNFASFTDLIGYWHTNRPLHPYSREEILSTADKSKALYHSLSSSTDTILDAHVLSPSYLYYLEFRAPTTDTKAEDTFRTAVTSLTQYSSIREQLR